MNMNGFANVTYETTTDIRKMHKMPVACGQRDYTISDMEKVQMRKDIKAVQESILTFAFGHLDLSKPVPHYLFDGSNPREAKALSLNTRSKRRNEKAARLSTP